MTEPDSPKTDTLSPEPASTASATNSANQPLVSGSASLWSSINSLDLGAQLYDWRGQTTAIFALLVILFAEPTARSATVGLLLIVWGALLRLYTAAFLGEGTWSRSPLPDSGELERRGPYAYVRHPLYAGNFLILTGFAVYSGVLWLAVVSVLAFSFQYYCVARYEDSVLEEHFGEPFIDYLRSVPAWIPARPMRLDDLDWPETWVGAITAEKKTLTIIALMLIALLFLG